MKDGALLKALQITDNGIGMQPSAFGSIFSEGGDHSPSEAGETSIYGRYGRGLLYALSFLSCHAIILSKSKSGGKIEWSCGVWNPRIKPEDNLIHYSILTGLDSTITTDQAFAARYDTTDVEWSKANESLNSIIWSKVRSVSETPIKDLPSLIAHFEDMAETGVRILLTLDKNANFRSNQECNDIVDEKGRSVKEDIPLWFLPRTHHLLTPKFNHYSTTIPPPQKITVQGSQIDWEAHPWCVASKKPGRVSSPLIKIKMGEELCRLFLDEDGPG